jgi:flagellar basal body rod protein FlgG
VLTPVISVEETMLGNSTIYPNPALNELYVSTPSINGGGSYSIYSATGSLIEQGGLYSSNTRIDINILPQGMYQLKLVYGNECITRSFIKQ